MTPHQQSSASAGNGVRVYEDGSEAAVLFVRAGDAEARDALTYVFALHRAPTVDLGHAVPDLDRTAGDCVIREDGILMTLQAVDPADWNGDHGMLGLSLDIVWGETAPVWKRIALETGAVWACLVTEDQYQQAAERRGSALLVDVAKFPPVSVLKLDALKGK